jgi:tetratricopeptide (TPR) repeat protein
VKWRSHRRPVWQPSKLSRLAEFLRRALHQLTLKRIALSIFILPLLFYMYREVTHDALIIDSFSVPKQFEETGFTPEVVANRIGNALRQIEAEAQTQMKKDNLASLHDEGSTPDVEIPGTKLGLKTLVEIARDVFAIYPKHVSGDIVVLTAESPSAGPRATVTVYLTQGRDRSRAMSLIANPNDIDSMAKQTAEMILAQVNPYILAVHRYDHGEVDKAAELIQQVLADGSLDHTKVAAAFNLQGNLLRDQKQYDEAIVKYEKAVELNPKFAPPHNNWGVMLYNQKKYEEAVAKYQKAIELDPKFAAAYYNWGILLQDQKKYEEAIAKYRKAIELDPKYEDSYYSWGNVLYERKKYDEAIAKYQQAIEVDPKSPLPYNSWGNALYNQKKYDQAIAEYQKAIEVDPRYALPYFNWGLLLSDQKKYDEAIARYQQALQLDPKYAAAYYNWGIVLRRQGRLDQAEEKLAKARELSPE